MWLLCFTGVFACCNGDTWASELGTVLSKSDPFLVTSFKRVPKGTNGGITLIGTLCSTIGGLVIGLAQYLTMLYFTDKTMLMYAPPQWPMIVFGAFAGFLGSLIDSFMGATLQYSGKHILLLLFCDSKDTLFLIWVFCLRSRYRRENSLSSKSNCYACEWQKCFRQSQCKPHIDCYNGPSYAYD